MLKAIAFALLLLGGFLTGLFLVINTAVASAGFAGCFYKASRYYGVPYWALRSIAKVESGGHIYAINIAGRGYFPKTYSAAASLIRNNASKSFDVGIMQVNKLWFDRLNYAYTDGLNPCFDIYLGAYVLKRKIIRYGNTWKGIAAYHSADPEQNIAYAWEVYDATQ